MNEASVCNANDLMPTGEEDIGTIQLSPFEDGHYSDTLWYHLPSHKSLQDTVPDMVSLQRALRHLYNKLQRPSTIVGYTIVVNTTLAWAIYPTTSTTKLRPVVPFQFGKICNNVLW